MREILLRPYRKLVLVIKAACFYFQEFSYFSNAKKKNIDPGLLIRKRAHHLERILFHNNLYNKEFKENVVKELEALLGNNLSLANEGYYKWARRLLEEYKTGSFLQTCPNLLNHKAPLLDKEITIDNVLSLIRNRRTSRIFLNEPLTKEQRENIVEAGLHAPSSCNRQTLSFIFIEDAKVKRFIASTVSGGKQFFASAPALLVVISYAVDFRFPEERHAPWIESAASVENILLACQAMGLGCCWGYYNSFGGMEKKREVRKILEIPEEYVITACLAIGKQGQNVCYIPRDNFKNRLFINKFKHQDE